jgi:phage-related protein
MSSIITSIKDLVASVLEVIVSVFHNAFDVTSGLLIAIVNSFIGTLRMALRAVGNIFEAAGGLGKFIASKLCFLSAI